MTLTPTHLTKVQETTQISLRRNRKIKGNVKVRARMCTSLFTCIVRIRTFTETLSIRIKGLGKRRRDPHSKT